MLQFSISSVSHQIASLLVYQSIFDHPVAKAFVNFLDKLPKSHQNLSKSSEVLKAYGEWFKALSYHNQSWADFIIEQVLYNENPFSINIQRKALTDLPESLINAVKHDLGILQTVKHSSPRIILEWLKNISPQEYHLIPWELADQNTTFLHQQDNWAANLEVLAHHYQTQGAGIFAQYKAFRWQEGKLIGIAYPDPIRLSQIVGYESQKETLIKNTEFLLGGYAALHVLLYGSRGTGKSSLVKGLLQEYQHQGLRLIEVSKSELKDLSIIVEQLRNRSQKFIIFVDDLSFEEDDETFKSLKVILEGSLTAKAQNVLVYATSNRRHLVREFFSDRPRPSDAEEVHNWDTVQEKLSFSDRFGLTLTFEPTNQDAYLNIVETLAQQNNIPLTWEDIEPLAKQWAIRHNGRSGRTARQFIDFLQAEIAYQPALKRLE